MGAGHFTRRYNTPVSFNQGVGCRFRCSINVLNISQRLPAEFPQSTVIQLKFLISRCPVDKYCIIGQGKRRKHAWEYCTKLHRCLHVKQDGFCSLPEAKLGIKTGPRMCLPSKQRVVGSNPSRDALDAIFVLTRAFNSKKGQAENIYLLRSLPFERGRL